MNFGGGRRIMKTSFFKPFTMPYLLLIALVTMAPGSCNNAGIKTQSPICKLSLNGALTNTLSIEQTYSTLPDFTGWHQNRTKNKDGREITEWANLFPWNTLKSKIIDMDRKLTDTSVLMKKARDNKCQEYQPEQGSCNIITQADEKIKQAKRVDPYYGSYKDFYSAVVDIASRPTGNSSAPGTPWRDKLTRMTRGLGTETGHVTTARKQLETAKQTGCF